MQIGYIRVSTNDQNTDLQRNALNCAGCELIFEDKISGTKIRPDRDKKLLENAIRKEIRWLSGSWTDWAEV